MKTSTCKRPVLTIIAVALLLLSFACQKNLSQKNQDTAGQSSVKIYLTDDPSLVFDKVLLDIQKVEIKVEDDSQEKHESEHQNEVDDHDNHGDNAGGWMTVGINPGVYDILKFRNGLDTLFGTGLFPAAQKLKKIRITLGKYSSIVLNGASFPLVFKGDDNIIVVKIDESSLHFNADGVLNFSIDIDAGRSISKHGKDFEFKASVKGFSKENTAAIEGRVLPRDANAIVMAVNGTDTASAKPESEGEFKFTGLKAGTYSLLYHATASNYRDTTVQNIIVRSKDDTKVATLTLHK
jgi:Domain of unknown function (DUF4382)